MKILQINSHYDQGGAARIVATIHRQLLEKGIEDYVAYGRGQKSDEKNVYLFGSKAGICLSALLSRISGWNGYFNILATRKLIRFIEKIKPDIVHMHTLHGYYLNVPMLFRYLNKKKISCVWTFHDCHAFVGNCGYFYECRKWEKGCHNCPYLKQYPTSQWFDHTREMWDEKRKLFTVGENKVIVTPSGWLTQEASRSFFGKYSCITIHNGVDTEKVFYPRNPHDCRVKYGFSDEEKLVLGIAVGYRDERKGARFILQLAKDLEKEARIILIGWNRENDHLKEGLDNVITIENTRDAQMLAEYYSMADVFVIPSMAENYATTVLEAMACGTPVVGFQVGGIPEQLEGKKGILVEAGNQQEFTNAVRKVLWQEDSVLRGKELAEIVRKENSITGMVEKYCEIYYQLLQKE